MVWDEHLARLDKTHPRPSSAGSWTDVVDREPLAWGLIHETIPKKKPRWRSKWSSQSLGDFIDIAVSSNCCKTKLIFVNSKNQNDGQICEEILGELKVRASSRGDVINK